MAVSHVYSSPVADATGTQTIWLGSSTVTVAASDLILPSHWNSVHNQVVTLTGNTAGVAVLTGTNIVFGGSNNVTLSGIQGANAATINVSAAAGGGGGSVNVSAGTTSNNLTNFVFADGNGVSFGLNGSTVTATVATNYQSAGAYLTTARASNDAIGLATAQSNVTWTANSAGLSLDARGYAGTGTTIGATNLSASATLNSNGLQLSLSAAAGGGGADGGNTLAAGTRTAGSNSAVLFDNSNGVTFGLNAVGGTVMTASVVTDYAGRGFTSTTTAGVDVKATLSTNGLSMAVPAYLTTAQPVGAYLTTARASNDAIGMNTAQSNVTWTVNSSGLSLDARGYAGTGTTFNGAGVNGSMTVNSGGVNLSLSVPSGSDTFQAVGVNTIATLNTSGTFANDVYAFSGAGIASVGITNNTVVISVPAGGGGGDGGVFAGVSNLGNTAGSTGTVSTGNFVLVGSNGITLSQSTGGAGSAATITIAGAPMYSLWENFAWNSNNTGTTNLSASTFQVMPVSLPLLSCSFVRLYASMVTNSTSFATTINTTFTMSKVSTFSAALYTLGTGASSQSLFSVASGSAGFTQLWSLGANSTGSQYTVTMNVTYPITGGTSSYSTSYATSQTRFDISSNSITGFTGTRPLDIPLATSFSEGQYWVVLGASTNTGTQATAAFSNGGFVYSGIHGMSVGFAAAPPAFALGGNATRDFHLPGLGVSSNAGGSATSAFAISNASLSSKFLMPYIQFRMT